MIDASQQQKEFLRQATANAGISGKLYIDAKPEECFVRLKVVDLANFDSDKLTQILCSALAMVGEGLNLEVKTYIRKGGKHE
jgi:hypothetical protein